MNRKCLGKKTSTYQEHQLVEEGLHVTHWNCFGGPRNVSK